MVKQPLVKAASNIATFERLVSITICDVLCINVYLPCEDSSVSSMNSLHEILANANIIKQSSAEYIIFGGDINVNVSKTTPHAHAVNEFLTTYKLTPGHAINNIAQAVPDKPDTVN